MTHCLRRKELEERRSLGCRRAAVTVRLEESRLVIVEGSIGVLDDYTQITPVPARLTVVSEAGEVLKPSKGSAFFMTTETFDPCHLVVELPK